jgi:hypothetical protein
VAAQARLHCAVASWRVGLLCAPADRGRSVPANQI